MFDNYTEFEIEIQARQGDAYPLAARSRAGEQRGMLQLPAADLSFQELLARLARLDTDESMLLELGTELFNALFADEIGKLYAASRSMLNADQGMIVRLRIAPGAEDAATLPWEFMADPTSGPISMMDAPVARYLPQPTPIPQFETNLPIKVLVTAAQTPPVADIANELEAVKSALESLGSDVQIHVEPHLQAANLRGYLREGFHVWHFVGHGGFDRTGKTAQLLLEDANGEADPLSAMELNIMLNRSGLRLVVLNACNSGKLAIDPFRSIAPALIRAQIPAVVAQQLNVAAESTRAFVGDFYRALAAGFPIDACVSEGRKAVMNNDGLGQPGWGIPVLYTRMASGKLFDLTGSTPAIAATPAPAPVASAQPTPAAKAKNTAPAPAAPAQPAADPQAEQIAALAAELALKRRALRMVQLRTSLYGIADVHHTRAAEQLEKEIAKLAAAFNTLLK
jgi:hypothetical protein